MNKGHRPLLARLDEAARMRKPLVLAHRGFSSRYLENSAEAFAGAVASGADGIELDVQLSADGVPVVFHDETLTRLAGRPDRVGELSADELSRIRLSRQAETEGVSTRGVPTLAAVFESVGPHLVIDVELKSYRLTDRPLLRAAVARAIEEHRMSQSVFVSSFDPRLVRRRDWSVPTSVIWCRCEELPRWLRRGQGMFLAGAAIAKPRWADLTTRRRVSRTPALVWTVNDAEAARTGISNGVAGMIGDDPERLLAWREGFSS